MHVIKKKCHKNVHFNQHILEKCLIYCTNNIQTVVYCLSRVKRKRKRKEAHRDGKYKWKEYGFHSIKRMHYKTALAHTHEEHKINKNLRLQII